VDPDSSPPSRLRRFGGAGPASRLRRFGGAGPASRLRRFGGAGPASRRRRSGAARLVVSVTDGRGRPVRVRGLARWLARVAPARARGEVAIALVSNARIRALNRDYRRQDHATDVLSFPSIPGEPHTYALPAEAGSHRTSDVRSLGDIVIGTGVAQRQAREAGHAYATELKVLALHGLLHLIGYDHERADDGGAMARVEARLRRKGGLTSGLIERGARRRRP
jgi:probable rRNA maturation factor